MCFLSSLFRLLLIIQVADDLLWLSLSLRVQRVALRFSMLAMVITDPESKSQLAQRIKS